MPRVKVGDIDIYYEVHGKGEPLVIICGASATTEAYSMLVPFYSKNHQVILFDNRGTGQTDAPDLPYSINMMANDLAGLLDFLEIQSVHIYGQSMGGMIAQQFAVSYPNRVRSLVLQCTTCGGSHSIPLKPSTRFDKEIRTKMTPLELGSETLRLCVTQSYIDRHPEISKMLIEEMAKQSEPVHGALRQSEAVRKFDCYDRLPEIKSPTLVLGGENDEAIPVENSKIIASRIPDSELVIFPEAGHILIESGNEPRAIIADFLEEHSIW
jgi:pimeloyl-ACP methyl ester carboxylesterase